MGSAARGGPGKDDGMSRRALAIGAAVVAIVIALGGATAWYFGLVFTSPSVAAGDRRPSALRRHPHRRQ
jgi:hypothetical protein